MAVTLTVKPTIISLTVVQTSPVTLVVGGEKISFDVYSVLPYVYTLFVTPPIHYNSTGMAGQLAYDDDYFYICVATDRWMKTPGIKNF